MNRKILAVSVLSMLVLFSIAARAQNLFTNGDFEPSTLCLPITALSTILRRHSPTGI